MWALWLVAVVLMAVLGLGSFLGIGAEYFGLVTASAPDVTGDDLMALLQASAWQTLLVLVFMAAASALGGVLGAREDLRVRSARVLVVRPRI